MDHGSAVSGLLMGGAEHGELYIWDPAKIISEDDSLVHKFSKHTGPVVALDINPFQVRYNSVSVHLIRLNDVLVLYIQYI